MKPLTATIALISVILQCSVGRGEPGSILAEVRREGEGNESARAAWQAAVAKGPESLVGLLDSAGKGGAVADNWVRVAASVIVDTALRERKPLPTRDVEQLLLDRSRPAAARRLAFDILMKADPSHGREVEMLLQNDPVQELRRGAVQRLIEDAKAKKGEESKAAFLQALQFVRDEDQTKRIADNLKTLGVPVDLAKHFGFITKWHVIGPFDNTDRKGFDTPFPPETEIHLDRSYPGKEGEVSWKTFESADEYGKVDLNKPLGMKKESTAYAVSAFDSPVDRDAELRLGCKNAWKVWINGDFLFGRDEYHRGQQIDQYVMKVRLKKGANTIIVKACQNEQKEDWTVEWEFQLRMCDSAGTAILSASAPN